LAKDQEDINRIIADVSKGSKFYENEKKKDKELTKKIEHILHLRDELTKNSGVDLEKIEANADQIASRPHSILCWTRLKGYQAPQIRMSKGSQSNNRAF
jgi:DNA polymerase kappa